METKQYIGIPFLDHGEDRNGCDCYGLIRMVYREQLGIELPYMGDKYSNAYARHEINKAVAQAEREYWNYDVTSELWKPYDIMVFSRAGDEAHVGLYIEPSYMLHIVAGAQTTRARYDTNEWKHRLVRVARHVDAS